MLRASRDVHAKFPHLQFFDARSVFIVTWHNVTFYGASIEHHLVNGVVDFLEILPYILAYKPTIFGATLTFKLWGRLIRGSCHTARVDSQHDGYLSATLTVCEPHMAWIISRSLWLRGCVGESMAGVLNDHLQRVR